MVGYGVEEFGPLGRSAGIGHVASNQNRMKRVVRMEGLQLRQQLPQPLVALRTRYCHSRFGNRSVRRRRGYPTDVLCATCGRCGRMFERVEVARLGHGRVGDRPNQRGRREIGAYQHDTVG